MSGIKFDVKTKRIETYPTQPSQKTLEERKIELLNELFELTRDNIYQYYSDIKQKSDISDKEFFETYIKIHNVDEIAFRQAIAQAVQNIFAGTSNFATELANLQTNFPAPATANPDEWNFAIEQLLKVAIRVAFVQRCKQVYYTYKQQIANATTEAQLPDLSTISFPTLPQL